MKNLLVFSLICLPWMGIHTFTLKAQESEPIRKTDTSEYITGDLDFNLIIAAEKGYTGEVLRLLNAGANIDARTSEGVTALMYAAQGGDAMMTELLLLNGADPSLVPDNGLQALHGAVLNNHLEIARRLVGAGADVNAPGPGMATPLMFAVLEDYYISDLLLQMGAAPDQPDAQGTTTLMVAALAGKFNILDRMIMDGANVNASDHDGFSPLMCAVQGGDTLSVKKLIEAGAKVGHKNMAGVSSLDLAIVNGRTDVVAILLKNGASPNEKNAGGLTALQLSRTTHQNDIQKLLLENGGKRSFNPVFNTVYGGLQAGGNHTDFQTGFLLGIRETTGSVRIETGFDLRPWEKRILKPQQEEVYLQLWEKRYFSWISVQKEWSWHESLYLSPFLGLKALYSWGSYQATGAVPAAEIKLVPQLGFSAGDAPLCIRLYAEYVDLDISWTFPVRLQLGVLWHIDLAGKKIKNKSLAWMN